MEGERAPKAFLRRRLEQRGLEGGEPGPADLVRAALGAQELRGLELGVGDVRAHHLVRRADAPVDGLRERQREAARAERPGGVVVHARDQLAGRAGRFLVSELPQTGRGRHVEAAHGWDAGVVVDDGPRLPDPARCPVGFVHDDQVPARQAALVGAFQGAQSEGGVGREHGDLVERPHPGGQLADVRRAGEGRVLAPQGGDADHGARAAGLPPGSLGLRQQVQRRHEHRHTARPEFVRALRGHQGLARTGRHDDLRAQPALRDSAGRGHLKGGPYGVYSLTLVGTEHRHEQSPLRYREMRGSAVRGGAVGQTCLGGRPGRPGRVSTWRSTVEMCQTGSRPTWSSGAGAWSRAT